jgi:hypothetical protein
MWSDTGWDWVVLGAGYVLALSLFRFLGGFAAAGTAITRWGSSSSRAKVAARLRAASSEDRADGGAEDGVVDPLRHLR